MEQFLNKKNDNKEPIKNNDKLYLSLLSSEIQFLEKECKKLERKINEILEKNNNKTDDLEYENQMFIQKKIKEILNKRKERYIEINQKKKHFLDSEVCDYDFAITLRNIVKSSLKKINHVTYNEDDILSNIKINEEYKNFPSEELMKKFDFEIENMKQEKFKDFFKDILEFINNNWEIKQQKILYDFFILTPSLIHIGNFNLPSTHIKIDILINILFNDKYCYGLKNDIKYLSFLKDEEFEIIELTEYPIKTELKKEINLTKSYLSQFILSKTVLSGINKTIKIFYNKKETTLKNKLNSHFNKVKIYFSFLLNDLQGITIYNSNIFINKKYYNSILENNKNEEICEYEENEINIAIINLTFQHEILHSFLLNYKKKNGSIFLKTFYIRNKKIIQSESSEYYDSLISIDIGNEYRYFYCKYINDIQNYNKEIDVFNFELKIEFIRNDNKDHRIIMEKSIKKKENVTHGNIHCGTGLRSYH